MMILQTMETLDRKQVCSINLNVTLCISFVLFSMVFGHPLPLTVNFYMNMYLYQHKYFKYLNIFYLVFLLKVTDGMRHLLHHGTHLPKYDQKTNSFHVQFATRFSAHVGVWPHTNTPITKIIPPLSS